VIADLLARIGLPKWALELLAVLALAGALTGAVMWYGHDQRMLGISQESARRDGIDRQRDAQAKAALAKLNADIATKQASLDAAAARIAQLGEELTHAQQASAARQRDYLSGARVLHVAATCPGNPAAAQQAQGTGPAAVDPASGQGAAVLAGMPASDLEWLRQTRDDALIALNACVASYKVAQVAQ
jgi:hypothetical protein